MYSLDITDINVEELGYISVREILHNDRLMTTEQLKDIIDLLNEIEKSGLNTNDVVKIFSTMVKDIGD